MALRMIMLGGPGAGKGTQARRLSVAYGIAHISSGEMFRQHVDADTEIGRQVKPLIDKGHLVPDEVTIEMLSQRLDEPDCDQGFLLDGFPRTLAQAEALEQTLDARGETLDVAVNLRVPDEEIVHRLSGRRQCPKCGSIRNVHLDSTERATFCDHVECNGMRLVQREDDDEETVRERLRVYHAVSEPIVRFYAARERLLDVDAAGVAPAELFEALRGSIDAYLARKAAYDSHSQ